MDSGDEVQRPKAVGMGRSTILGQRAGGPWGRDREGHFWYRYEGKRKGKEGELWPELPP